MSDTARNVYTAFNRHTVNEPSSTLSGYSWISCIFEEALHLAFDSGLPLGSSDTLEELRQLTMVMKV